ncbi:hypothetical protein OC844_003609 [Tilletia horrida]|nr:hypothetical protein OC844_003609 [Tilletia horrida]
MPKRSTSGRSSPKGQPVLKRSAPKQCYNPPHADSELTALQHRDLLAFGRAQGWPTDAEEGIAQRVFGRHQAFTENLLVDLAEELKTSSTNYTLTDLRGSGYYGPYHALLITQALKHRLLQLAPGALPVALAKAVTNVIPMIFIKLIADDMRADQTAAARVLKLSRLYGDCAFPAALLGMFYSAL